MPELKWVRLLGDNPPPPLPTGPVPEFDISRLAPKGFKARLTAAAYRRLLWPGLRLLQAIKPVVGFGKLTLVTRAEDVRGILLDTARFHVPFGPEMAAFGGGATFLLGIDGPEHDRLNAILRELMTGAGDLRFVEDLSASFAEALLDAGKGCLDAQRDLMMRVAAEVCCRYFGFSPDDIDDFIDWTLAGSNFLFADPFGGQVAAELAAVSSKRLCALADKALDGAGPGDPTLAGRLVARIDSHGDLTRDDARAILIGLAIGFVPTNSLAGGKVLLGLKRNPQAREMAIAAAVAGDHDRLKSIVLELARLDPALAPGQWRWCPEDATIERASGGHATIKGGSVVLVSTLAALRDRRAFARPNSFDPDRSEKADLLFGVGPHTCLGEYLSIAQIVPTIAALLRRKGIGSAIAGLKMDWLGPYPASAPVTYTDARADPDNGRINQNGVLFSLPLAPGIDAAQADRIVERELTSGRFDWRAALDATGLVHFASLTGIDLPEQEIAPHRLMLEINSDGPALAGAGIAVRAIEEPLRAICRQLTAFDGGDLWSFIAANRVHIAGRPWGATGLQFYGVPDLSVEESTQQRELAAFARKAIDAYQHKELGRNMRASAVLRAVRNLIRDHRRLAPGAALAPLAAEASRFEHLLLKPSSRRLNIMDWDRAEERKAWSKVWRSAVVQRTVWTLVAIAVVAGIALSVVMGLDQRSATVALLALPWLVLQAFIGTALFAILFGGIFLLILRYKERTDTVDRERPTLDHLRALMAREDLPGHVKNHITVVTPLKKGLFRRFTLAIALWGIGQLVTHFYRPGYILSMGTIQFARWVRLPGTDTMIFQSNFDGSWESYLEDFITRANEGQTAAWSNCDGFPRSRFMIFDGAEDGDWFKQYVRRKQAVTQFWYSRFYDVTADRLRRNALIHEGLCRATSESEARAWLALFGSTTALPDVIEHDEVQTVVFSGFGKLPCADFLLLRLPEDRPAIGGFLQALTGFGIAPGSIPPSQINKVSALFTRGHLAKEFQLSFGEIPERGGAASLAFSIGGLTKILGPGHPLYDQLPGPLRMGMAARSPKLGDEGEESAANWRWCDSGSPRTGVDALLTIYSSNPVDHAQRLDGYRALIRAWGIAIVDQQAANPLSGEFPRDNFGFRDGMVQPLIEGTLRATEHANPDDLVKPGEMIFGYRNAQGFVPPALSVPASADPDNLLPDAVEESEAFPRFDRPRSAGEGTPAELRDFGRNGSMMAIRVIEQHDDAFARACDKAARDILADYPNLPSALARTIDGDWVAAKLIGRWKSGASLIGNPSDPHKVEPGDYRLDFGRGDTQGHHCPLGSHVRRANPRDSLVPGDPQEVAIANRHRLIRRGRTYRRDGAGGAGGAEKGLFFVAICEDLERQFEFVQKTWLKASNFHALDDGGDPILGRSAGPGRFSIPTAGGTITATIDFGFTTLRAGGYFFLPSRSAIAYLANWR